MKKPALKLDVLIFHPSYGGNGGVDSEHPHIREWAIETVLKMKADPRVGEVYMRTIGDTPLTMSRNRAITIARELGCHLLLSVDSDQSPCAHADEPWFKPFWNVAFDYIYENYGKGPNMIVAPYVGPAENVYCFEWRSYRNEGLDGQFSLEQIDREKASMMTGIQELAAGPTGMFLMDMRCAELVEPVNMPKREILEQVQCGKMSVDDAIYALRDGWFYYEFENQFCDKKASTEDVTFTRDLSLAGMEKLGYNPLKCAWDSWIGHWKPRNCKRPQRFSVEQVGASLRRAVLENRKINEVQMDLSTQIDSGIPAEFLTPPPGYKPYNGNGNGHAKPEVFHGRNINYQFVDRDNVPPATDQMADGYRTTHGRWFVHGHAPKEHCNYLADLVRSEGYRKDRELQILEVGSWLGTTAIAMADASTHARVHCVDTWNGSATDLTGELATIASEEDGEDAVYRMFCHNIGDRLDKTIFPWRGTSEEQAKKAWPKTFDIAFIDAEHTYEALKAQILEWWPHLATDGIMAGHDFNVEGFGGVVQAVEEIFGDKYTTFGWTPQGCMWQVRKQDFPEGHLLEQLEHVG